MSDRRWNHNTHYHPLALRFAASAATALDVGCGEGMLTRELRAAGAAAVTGLDLDADQVARAQSLGLGDDGLTYLVGNVLETPQAEQFDLVTCFATLHHLDVDDGLRRLRDLVSPGGHLVVVGLARVATPTDAALSLAAVPTAMVADKARGVWEHGAPMRDPEHSYGEVQAAARSILPGARWRRHLYWRYSVVWQAPA